MGKSKKEELEIKQETEEVKPKIRTKSQILNELKNKEDSINIEILNIGIGNATYISKSGTTYFDLEIGESEIISLKLVKEISMKSISFFKNFVITISNVFPEEINIDDVLMYLGLDRLYKDIDNYNVDFLNELILDNDEKEFKKELDSRDKKFAKMIASKMIQLYRSGEDIPNIIEKEKVITEILDVDGLKF